MHFQAACELQLSAFIYNASFGQSTLRAKTHLKDPFTECQNWLVFSFLFLQFWVGLLRAEMKRVFRTRQTGKYDKACLGCPTA